MDTLLLSTLILIIGDRSNPNYRYLRVDLHFYSTSALTWSAHTDLAVLSSIHGYHNEFRSCMRAPVSTYQPLSPHHHPPVSAVLPVTRRVSEIPAFASIVSHDVQCAISRMLPNTT